MPPDPLPTAIWGALTTSHEHLALAHGLARCYPASVAPFAALQEATPAALDDLLPLLAPAESIYLLGDRPPEHPELRWDAVVRCLQMVFPEDAPVPDLPTRSPQFLPLTWDHAPEMLALTTVAFPGYFRAETCRMGRYWGLRDTRRNLIAMGGERLIISPPGQPSWCEISGLCSHPRHAGRGTGTAILAHILAQHRVEGSRSWLHVTDDNARAIALYRRFGFLTVRPVEAHRLQRVPSSSSR